MMKLFIKFTIASFIIITFISLHFYVMQVNLEYLDDILPKHNTDHIPQEPYYDLSCLIVFVYLSVGLLVVLAVTRIRHLIKDFKAPETLAAPHTSADTHVITDIGIIKISVTLPTVKIIKDEDPVTFPAPILIEEEEEDPVTLPAPVFTDDEKDPVTLPAPIFIEEEEEEPVTLPAPGITEDDASKTFIAQDTPDAPSCVASPHSGATFSVGKFIRSFAREVRDQATTAVINAAANELLNAVGSQGVIPHVCLSLHFSKMAPLPEVSECEFSEPSTVMMNTH